MNAIFSKTLGGLSKEYYIRQMIFSLIFGGFLIWASLTHLEGSFKWGNITMYVICTLLYPYSRFVYETIIQYILGNNQFFVNGLLFLITKFITMLICFMFSIFIAPIGLLYLYYHHSKNTNTSNTEQ
jgi:hypothetical protein